MFYVIDQKNYIKLDWLVAMLNMGLGAYGGAINPTYANPTQTFINHAYIIGFPQMSMAL